MATVPSNLIPTRITQLPTAPEADPDGLLVYVLNGVTYKIAAGDLLQVAGVPTSRNVLAGTGMTGGGPLSSDVTLSVAVGGINATLMDATGVTPGLYGAAAEFPQIQIDANGRITSAVNIPISGSGLGTVSSVDVDGGTTGLAFTGGPITTFGVITMSGTLAIANGGTGATTSTGSGAVVLASSPTLVTPDLGTPSALVGTNITGTASGLTAGDVPNAAVIGKVLTGYLSGAGVVAATDTILEAINKLNGNDATNANLTGPITSVGNTTSVASQTGTGSTFVMDTSPTLVTPALGTPSALVGTNITGTAAGLTAGNVTTNANLTGPITSIGNATAVASQTGTGSTFVMNTSPTLVTPLLGTPTSGVLTNCTGTAAGLTAGLATAIAGGAASQIHYQSGAGVTAFLANGTAGQVLTSAGASAPTWAGISGGTF